MSEKMAIKYIKELARDSYEIDPNDIEDLINQLLLEEVLIIK